MKCLIVRHVIWAFTVCQSTFLGVSSPQKVLLPNRLYYGVIVYFLLCHESLNYSTGQ